MSVLEQALAKGAIRDLDLQFAVLVQRLATTESDHLLLAAAMASRAAGEGHLCLELRREADRPVLDGAGFTPPLEAWRLALGESGVVGTSGSRTPLILDLDDRLYLARYWHFERRLADALIARAGWVDGVDEARLREGLTRLFPAEPVQPDETEQLGLFDEVSSHQPDWQRLAAALALLRRFSVISGGPGTGKTRTVTSILALLVEQGVKRIALTAPTGKAAARLSESIKLAKGQLPLSDAVGAAIPEEALTLHRLLGVMPGRVRARHHAGNPLHLDLLVVDEASMVDLPLMARLLDALPERTRLILLGDRDQLASVEAGAVLGDICGEPGTAWSDEACERLARVTGERLHPARGMPPMADSIALLRKSYRFDDQSGIGALARAVNAGSGADALATLINGRYADIALHPAGERRSAARIAEAALEHYREYLEAESPEAALAAFGRFRILCALREGPFGVARANETVERALRGAGLIPEREGRRDGGWYAGRPIMVTRNDYALGLFNGDIGLLFPDAESGGALRAHFPRPDGGLRRLHPNRLPEVVTVYAMTVHKSQGSEFDRVLLSLPTDDSPVVTRELLYTGITRAKRAVELCATNGAVEGACQRRVHRASGLQQRLWSPPTESDSP